jgi:hypothetical protein
MPQTGFKPTNPVFQQKKAVHASDCAATVVNVTEIVTNNSIRVVTIIKP